MNVFHNHWWQSGKLATCWLCIDADSDLKENNMDGKKTYASRYIAWWSVSTISNTCMVSTRPREYVCFVCVVRLNICMIFVQKFNFLVNDGHYSLCAQRCAVR